VAESNLRRAIRVEAGQHDAPLVGDAVAVRVFQVQKIRRHGHEHTAVPWHDPVGVRQRSREIRTPVVAAVAVGIGEKGDDALRRRRTRALERIRIAAILGDLHAAALVERDRYRTLYERLRRNEIDPVSGFEHEARQRFGGRERRTILTDDRRHERRAKQNAP
jgi:hypothetical protein